MPRRRVLLVDDDTDFRTVMQEVLDTSGYVPAGAVDGTEGLAQAERLPPDVILLDIRMPGLNGYEVCRRLKQNPATAAIPVIFLTGVQDLTLERLAYEAGAVACIT